MIQIQSTRGWTTVKWAFLNQCQCLPSLNFSSKLCGSVLSLCVPQVYTRIQMYSTGFIFYLRSLQTKELSARTTGSFSDRTPALECTKYGRVHSYPSTFYTYYWRIYSYLWTAHTLSHNASLFAFCYCLAHDTTNNHYGHWSSIFSRVQ